MKWVLALTLFTAAAPMYAAAPEKKKASASKPAPPAKTHYKSSVTAPVRTASASKRSSKSVHSRRSAAPSYQLHPDSDRYQEIQKALADRGYFKGDVNGTWGDDSVAAMQRFQADQKLDPDGKINALTLIGLGLGPKHGSAPVASAASNPDLPPPHIPPADPQ